MTAEPAPADIPGWIMRLRTRGAARADPVRWRLIEAMARRARPHGDAARALIDQRLAQLLAATEAALAAPRMATAPRAGTGAATGAASQATPHPATPRAPSPLATLRAELAAAAGAGPSTTGTTAPPGPPPELRALRDHRATWARLDAAQRLQRLALPVPDNAGPLNTQRLLQQALQLLHDTAPDYLASLLRHLETLQWLEQGLLTDLAPRRAARPRAERS